VRQKKFLTQENSVLKEFWEIKLQSETGLSVVYLMTLSLLKMLLSQIKPEDGLYSLILKVKPIVGSRIWKKKSKSVL
jgi:hypothetical protein